MTLNHLTVGILAVTPEGGALAFRDLSRAFYARFGAYHNPHIIMTMQPLIDHVESFGDAEAWTALVQAGINDLRRNGADIIWMPANSSHLVMDRIDLGHCLFVNMIDCAVEALKRDRRPTLVLGTNVSLSDKLYFRAPDKLTHCVPPDDADQQSVHALIVNELVQGNISRHVYQYIHELIDKHRRGDSIDKVFLACTELPCFFGRDELGIAIDDSISASIPAVINATARLAGIEDEGVN